ncbi:MAG: helix-turn-helix domain-containing protein [Gemmataceae bacterium]
MNANGVQPTLFGDAASAPAPRSGRRGAASALPAGQLESLSTKVDAMQLHLDKLEALLVDIAERLTAPRTDKASYTTGEVAKLLGKRPFTVREWCRLGRVNAFKANCGRGGEVEWRIGHEELERIRNDGLLPAPSAGIPRL